MRNVLLWIAQAILAALLTWAAGMKLFQSPAQLAAMWPWAAEVPVALVKFTGIVDLTGGLGLVLPGILRLKNGWTAAAAFGIVLLMICAGVFHAMRGEAIWFNVFMALVAAGIGWGRLRR